MAEYRVRAGGHLAGTRLRVWPFSRDFNRWRKKQAFSSQVRQRRLKSVGTSPTFDNGVWKYRHSGFPKVELRFSLISRGLSATVWKWAHAPLKPTLRK